jgi:Zn-dependent peptidase ImmA (M78 family)
MVHRRGEKSAVIGVNSTHSRTRQAFTIAHELGHLLLHGDVEVHIDERRLLGRRDQVSSKAVDPREIEANQFAAELLMPEDLIRSAVVSVVDRHPEITVEDAIVLLARSFRVSELAMTHRLNNLRILGPEDDVAG